MEKKCENFAHHLTNWFPRRVLPPHFTKPLNVLFYTSSFWGIFIFSSCQNACIYLDRLSDLYYLIVINILYFIFFLKIMREPSCSTHLEGSAPAPRLPGSENVQTFAASPVASAPFFPAAMASSLPTGPTGHTPWVWQEVAHLSHWPWGLKQVSSARGQYHTKKDVCFLKTTLADRIHSWPPLKTSLHP